MTLPDELIQGIVLKIGGSWGDAAPEDRQFFRRFAALVAAHEREECAKVCEAGIVQTNYLDASDWNESCENRAAAIRARGER